MVKYHTVSVHVDRINVVSRCEGLSSRKYIADFNSENVTTPAVELKRQIKYSIDGNLSVATQRKLKRSVKYLNYITKKSKQLFLPDGRKISGKLVFLTLTLSSPQVHTDQEIKSLLINQFVVELKKCFGITHYVWRIEKQSNGNAHFHFILDRFIGWDWVRETWNRIQNKLGYVDRYQAKMQSLTYKEYQQLYINNKHYTPAKIKATWQKGKRNNWRYPNSVDIHSLQFINDIDTYLIKYLSKNEQNKGIEGRLWGCSHSLSNLDGGQGLVDSALSDELNRVFNCPSFFRIKHDYIDTVFLDPLELYRLGCWRLLFLLESFLSDRFQVSAVELEYPIPDFQRTPYERYYAQ